MPSLFGPDTFEDGDAAGWTATTPAQWKVLQDGATKAYRRDSTSSTWNESHAGAGWLDQTASARVKIVQWAGNSTSYMASVYARYSSAANAYYAALREDGRMVLRKRRNNGNSNLVTVTIPGGFNAGTWYDVKLEAKNSGSAVVLKMFLNGVQQGATFTDSMSPLGTGQVAVGSYGSRAEFDDVTVQ